MFKKIWLVLLFLTSPLYLQNLFFTNLSYSEKFTFLKPVDSVRVMIGSTGGAILFNSMDYSYQIYNFTNGFPSNYITCAAKLDDQNIILGTYDGHLIIFNLNDEKALSSNTDLLGEKIVDIYPNGNSIWVVTNDKIAVFSLNSNELKFIDIFSNFPLTQIDFLKILLTDNYVLAATSDGIVVAPNDFTTFNLKSEAIWHIVRDTLSVPLSNIYDAIKVQEQVYILNDGGVFLLGSGFETATQIKSVTAEKFIWDGSFKFLKDSRIFDDQVNWNFPENLKDFTSLKNGVIAISDRKNIYFRDETSLDTIPVYSFPMDLAGEIIKSSKGHFYTNGSPPPYYVNNGMVAWDKDTLTHFYWNGNVWMNRTRFVTEIKPGVILTGTWGAGFWIYNENNHTISVMNNFDSTSTYSLSLTHIVSNGSVNSEKIDFSEINKLPSVLSEGIGFEASHLVFIADAVVDSIHGYLWLLQYIPGNSKNLIGFPFTESGIDFSPDNAIQISIPGISQNAIYSMAIDLWGGIWLGTPFNGLVYVNLEAYFQGENYVSRFLESDGLASNNVISLAADKEGYLLIGTAAGTNVWTGSQLLKLREDYQPVGLQINSIYVDALGNRWFATDAGVSLLKKGFVPWNPEGWVHFVANSSNVTQKNIIRTNVPDQDFYGIYVDYQNNEVLFSTKDGIFQAYHFPGLAAASSRDELVAFPNPAFTGSGQVLIRIKNILPNSVVKILNVNGKLIRELNPDQRNEFSAYWATWDGKDESGAFVPTGVYIVYSINENGESQIGKVFVIQK